MRPGRLLMTTDAVGGIWRYALDLARGLGDIGVETTLLGFGPRPTRAQSAEAERVAQLVWSDHPLDWMARDAVELAGVPETVALHAGDSRADLVQVNVPSQAAGLALDLPVVAASHSCVASWFHVFRGTDLPEGWRWQRDLTGDGLAAARAVVTPSDAFARVLARCYPGLGPVMVVPNATATLPSTTARQPCAYAAARWWDEGKNAGALDAAAGLSRHPVFAAGSTTRPDGQRVEFRHARHLGQLEQAAVHDLAASAELFISPSIYEPFGLAALEAARLGAALVLSDIPTYREIWEDAALFADPHDPAAFAAALDRLMKDTDLRAAHRKVAAHRAAAFSVPAQARRMRDLYLSLIPQHEPVGAT